MAWRAPSSGRTPGCSGPPARLHSHSSPAPAETAPMRPGLPWLSLALLALGSAVRADDSLAKYDALIRAADRAHWAFRSVRPVSVPSVKDSGWAHNPIDAFV